MSSLPPLSGAILVSNPRKEMPSTHDNPNNRRTVNLIARVAMGKKGKGKLESKVQAVAKQWFSERNKPADKRKVSRTALYGEAGERGAAFKKKKGSTSKLRATSEQRKADYAVARRVAAQSLAKLYKLKGAKADEYVDRVLGAKGDAYLSSDKKMSKSFFGGTRKGSAVNVKGVRSWNATSVARRASGKWGHAHGSTSYRSKHPFAKKHAAAIKRAKATLKSGVMKKIKHAKAEDWKMAKKSSRKKAGSTASRRRSGRKVGTTQKRLGALMKKGHSMKAAWRLLKKGKVSARKHPRKAAHRKARSSARRSRRNPEVSALMNPEVSALMNPRKKRKSKAKARKHTRRGRKISAYNRFIGKMMKKGHTMAEAAAQYRGGKKKGKKSSRKSIARRVAAFSNTGRRRGARRNPEVSALMNPTMAGAKQYLLAYALPVTVAGAAAGGIHAFAAHQGWTDKISTFCADNVPVVGTYLAKAPFTIQGAGVGAVLALAAPMVGGKAGEALALAGGAALIFGGGIDAFNILKDKLASKDAAAAESTGDLAFGDLAFGDLAFGDLAFGDLGAVGFKKGSSRRSNAGSAPYGDGFAFELAPLTASVPQVNYSQASLHDAYYSGADFSAAEGQAILNGQADWTAKFGPTPARMGTKATLQSHLAGRHGHRWGWLVKLVGWEKAQQIAALPPKQRIEVIRKIRAAALAASRQEQQAAKASEVAHQAQMEVAPASVSGATAQAPSGPAGAPALNGLGDLAFGDLALAGEDYGATLFAQA